MALQLYGADERTTGVVPVNYAGRSTQAAVGWAPGQVTPSQMILVGYPAPKITQTAQRPVCMQAPTLSSFCWLIALLDSVVLLWPRHTAAVLMPLHIGDACAAVMCASVSSPLLRLLCICPYASIQNMPPAGVMRPMGQQPGMMGAGEQQRLPLVDISSFIIMQPSCAPTPPRPWGEQHVVAVALSLEAP